VAGNGDVSIIISPLDRVRKFIYLNFSSPIIIILFGNCVLIMLLFIVHSPESYSSFVQYFNTHVPLLNLIGVSTSHSFNIMLNKLK